ncbi:hypothetical protein [Thermonema rossianum]|uniref:hypothetical protein n=1 Tax=Thermonema rossianum TaxID=55505 RepID=UPI0012F7AA93|nr:hypothetical protein [Thermonema rossianum]
MDRNKLLEFPGYDASKYDEVDRLISITENKLDDGEDARDEIAQIHALVGKVNEFTEYTFRNYWRSISKEELIERILTPHPPEIDKLSRDEILLVLKKMTETEIEHSSYYLELLSKNTPYAYSLSDLVYWPHRLGYPPDLSLEEMAGIIFRNEPPPVLRDRQA